MSDTMIVQCQSACGRNRTKNINWNRRKGVIYGKTEKDEENIVMAIGSCDDYISVSIW